MAPLAGLAGLVDLSHLLDHAALQHWPLFLGPLPITGNSAGHLPGLAPLAGTGPLTHLLDHAALQHLPLFLGPLPRAGKSAGQSPSDSTRVSPTLSTAPVASRVSATLAPMFILRTVRKSYDIGSLPNL